MGQTSEGMPVGIFWKDDSDAGLLSLFISVMRKEVRDIGILVKVSSLGTVRCSLF